MSVIADEFDTPAAFRADLGTIFVSLELSKSTWLVTSLSPGREKMSRRTIAGGDVEGLFACFAQLREKAQERQASFTPRS
jgi:transposase